MVLASAAQAPAAPRRTTPTPAQLRHAAERAVAAGIPGVVALVREGRRTVRVAAGAARLEPRRRMRPGDRFRVGSITKTFVATVVLQLAGERRLGLDDPLERWLPGSVPNAGAITLRMLLSHRSGLYDYLSDPRVTAPYLAGNFAYAWTPQQLVAIATEHPALFAPGTRFSYSNTNYILLGLVVQAVTGHAIQAELAARILRPLRLRRTSFDTGGHIRGPHAHGYFIPAPGRRLDATAVSPSEAWAAGALVSTAADVARFYRALLRGRLLGAGLLRAMATLRDGYGLGLFRVGSPCGALWGHDGAVAGYVSLALSRRDGRRQLVVLANSLTAEDTVGPRRAQRALERLARVAACGRTPA